MASAEVVLEMLQQFETEVLALRSKFFLGTGGEYTAEENLLALCKQYGDKFDGTNTDYDQPNRQQVRSFMRITVDRSKDEECQEIWQKARLAKWEHNEGKALCLLLAKITMYTADLVGNGMSQEKALERMADVNKHFCMCINGIRPL